MQHLCAELRSDLAVVSSSTLEADQRRVHQLFNSKFAMPSSFKRNHDLAPLRYRTPSPPRCDFEPISPIHIEDATAESLTLGQAENTATHNGHLKRPHLAIYESSDDVRCEGPSAEGAMNTFLSIAQASKPSSTFTGAHSTTIYHDTGRPSKRAKSETLSSSHRSKQRIGSYVRPATSYEQSMESRKLEAELLLNFAHEAAKLAGPSPLSFIENMNLSREVSESSQDKSTRLTARSPLLHEGQRENVVNWKSEDTKTDSLEHAHSIQEPITKDKPLMSGAQHYGQGAIALSGITTVTCDYSSTTSDLKIDTSRRTPSATARFDGVSSPTGCPQEYTSEGQEIGAEEPEIQDIRQDSPLVYNPQSQKHGLCDQRYVTTQNVVHTPAGDTDAVEDAPRIMEDLVQMTEDQDKDREGDPKTVSYAIISDSHSYEFQDEPQVLAENESRTIHGPLGDQMENPSSRSIMGVADAKQPTSELKSTSNSDSSAIIAEVNTPPTMATAVCAACKFVRNSTAIESDNASTSWISCDDCKSWFHFACAGFKNEREVRSVDKFRCRKCKPLHGSTTYVRKSSRAHSAIDYAGLHQGVIKTSDERPEHHYIKPIKDGTITFLPENFARMRPDLVTAEFFEKGNGMKEPIVIPACLNPRPKVCPTSGNGNIGHTNDAFRPNVLEDNDNAEDWFSRHPEPEAIPDQGQDALDMVIPQGLTVRQVAELYGPEEKVEVIDVKSQNGENKKWNMRRWADYYENPNNKVVRNVISLEISQSKLGRLIRRPQIVRDLDLQDSVWPEELLAKGEYPRVQFYCLMSVCDCFTDFHIDFGGSSVFYHILKGKKTFLFIPPKEKHLKKYEEWCMSPAQNWTFLGDQTKECYRVDLTEGDTMLIPAGWIHAVWTPEDSLVIGGNFLTRLNFGMQFRVAQVEKATGVARKFRYPQFQKLHWYTALRYLEEDPLPSTVKDVLHAGGSFVRNTPTHNDFDAWGENSKPSAENYHARYYSQSELDGLPDLVRYLLRTALIDIGSITDGISVETRNAVKKSMPRGHGEPLDILKTFAAWCAWKRGNESIPHWAYPDSVPETLAPDKLSAAATKKLDMEAALQAPRRQSARMQSQHDASEAALSLSDGMPGLKASNDSNISSMSTLGNKKGTATNLVAQGPTDMTRHGTLKKFKPASGTGGASHRKTACDSCRKRRRACKHKDQTTLSKPDTQVAVMGQVSIDHEQSSPSIVLPSKSDSAYSLKAKSDCKPPESKNRIMVAVPEQSSRAQASTNGSSHGHQASDLVSPLDILSEKVHSTVHRVENSLPAEVIKDLDPGSGPAVLARPRHKACDECRKSKVRTIFYYPQPRLIICTASLHT